MTMALVFPRSDCRHTLVRPWLANDPLLAPRQPVQNSTRGLQCQQISVQLSLDHISCSMLPLTCV